LISATSIFAADDAALNAKRIIIPRIELRQATVAEAMEWLEAKSKELDPSKKGVRLSASKNPWNKTHHVTLRLSNVSVMDAVTQICDAAEGSSDCKR
jgi:hypothetical protein